LLNTRKNRNKKKGSPNNLLHQKRQFLTWTRSILIIKPHSLSNYEDKYLGARNVNCICDIGSTCSARQPYRYTRQAIRKRRMGKQEERGSTFMKKPELKNLVSAYVPLIKFTRSVECEED
jgi:hypothetical protein